MIYDAGNVTPGSELSAEICIVGSGAAALSMAHRLISSGRKIIILESSRFNPQMYDLKLTCHDTAQTHEGLNPSILYRGSVGSFVSSLDPAFLTTSRKRCYGGSTNCWGGWTRPMDAVDFDRSDLNPLFAWPLERDDLHDFYNLAIQYCSLGTWDVSAYDDPHFWTRRTRHHVAPLSLRSDALIQNRVITIINRSGVGGGRLAFQLAWGPSLEEASNVALYRNANARYFVAVGGRRSVQGLIVSTISNGTAGHDFTVKADCYVIAAGGIETARLLLASDALGNHHDQVGRCFMVHPVNEEAAIFTAGPALSQAARHFHFGAQTNVGAWPPSVLAIVTPTAEALKKNGIGNCRVRLASDDRISFTWEQVPNPDSRITLDVQRDPVFGDPLVRLDWRPAALDVRTMMTGLTNYQDTDISAGSRVTSA